MCLGRQPGDTQGQCPAVLFSWERTGVWLSTRIIPSFTYTYLSICKNMYTHIYIYIYIYVRIASPRPPLGLPSVSSGSAERLPGQLALLCQSVSISVQHACARFNNNQTFRRCGAKSNTRTRRACISRGPSCCGSCCWCVASRTEGDDPRLQTPANKQRG